MAAQNQRVLAQLNLQGQGLAKCFQLLRAGSESLAPQEKEQDAELERLAKRLKDDAGMEASES